MIFIKPLLERLSQRKLLTGRTRMVNKTNNYLVYIVGLRNHHYLFAKNKKIFIVLPNNFEIQFITN